VPCARLHVRHLLREWGLNGLATDSELLTSELVTNAVKATAGQQQAAIRLRLSSDSARVLVEVWDANPQPALSARWDWYPTEELAGKVVWCELRAL